MLSSNKRRIKSFPEIIQSERNDCGPTCIKMIASYHGVEFSLDTIRDLCETNRSGSTLTGLINSAEKIGFDTRAAKTPFEKLQDHAELFPAILHWNHNHFVVLFRISRNRYYVSDPELGICEYNEQEFLSQWIGEDPNMDSQNEGVILYLSPSENGFSKDLRDSKPLSFLDKLSILLSEKIKENKFLFYGLFALVLIAIVLEFSLPFFIQGIVDHAISEQSYRLLGLFTISYIFLYLTLKFSEIIREWILIILSMKINISLVSAFMKKLSKLPISYFDTKDTGDIIERIEDHEKVEQLVLTGAIFTLFSSISLLLYSIILLVYNPWIFLVYLTMTVVFGVWVSLFFKYRRKLDFKKFALRGKENSTILEVIGGMQELKLNNAQELKQEKWEKVKTDLYKVLMSGLKIEQLQIDGATIISEIKKIIIISLSAYLVISNDISFGMLLAISYILGQTDAPMHRLISSFNQFQDTKISLERIFEIRNRKEEKTGLKPNKAVFNKEISISELSFKYPGKSAKVLESISFKIPANKTTAIVGMSGSGKTTLLKLLLMFYENFEGQIKIGDISINTLDPVFWRNNCGVVMQEGYIFNDTIKNNIIMDLPLDQDALDNAIKLANLSETLLDLPLGLETKIGNEGQILSTGQKQRIQIARAVYKNPELLLFDEATSALDSKNEREISQNLNTFFKNKTTVIIAHRLSTVKNAENIIVLEKGQIKEQGSHSELSKNVNGTYFNLVQNQLDL